MDASIIYTKVCIINWLGRQDSNLRMPVPKTGALPLGHAPMQQIDFNLVIGYVQIIADSLYSTG